MADQTTTGSRLSISELGLAFGGLVVLDAITLATRPGRLLALIGPNGAGKTSILNCICGIPTVTLEGSTADWQRLTDKAVRLSVFDLDWWLPHLLPICEQFVRASRGDVDGDHWRDICKRRSEYGGDVINGWVAKLFPYLRTFIGGPCTRRNPIFETGEGFQSLVAPSGLSRVPFTWQNASTASCCGTRS